MNEYKKISVITVTYNAESTIEETIKSVISQNYSNLEYIIIDGKSTDNTIPVINSYHNVIDYFISEQDNGIYDAMNKGIKIASGECTIFMNAGDKFYNNQVLHSIDSFIKELNSYNVIYGSTKIHYPFGTYIVKPDDINKLTRCMPFCHQSVFVRTELLKQIMFDSNLTIVGDHNLLLKIYKINNEGFKQYDGVIADYDAQNGISSKQTIKGYSESKSFAKEQDSLFRKIRIQMRAYLPYFILNPLCRLFFYFNNRFQRVKES